MSPELGWVTGGVRGGEVLSGGQHASVRAFVDTHADRKLWGYAMHIEAGKMVCLEYVLSLMDGTVVDSTEGSGLWTYVHGETKMPPGLSRGIEGLEVGEHARL